MIPAWENGFFAMTQASLIKNFAGKLSVPSMIKSKVKSAKETINAMNPDVTVKTYRQFVTSENNMDLIADYDFIIDGT